MLPILLRRPFAVLAGAGISYAPPSCLPTAAEWMRSIISALPLPDAQGAELRDATSPAWPKGLGYYHFLRFEQILEALRLTIDPKLETLAAALPDSPANTYHHALAALIEAGFPVLTTNFDSLIEKACAGRGTPISVLATQGHYVEYEKHPDRFPRPLFKLHGSLTGSLAAVQTDVIGTFDAVSSELIVGSPKWSVIYRILSSHDLLVIGYSGGDDFDVMPIIAHAKNGRRLCWIGHSPADSHDVYTGLEGRRSLLAYKDRKLSWFFNRMFLSLERELGRVSRDPAGVCIVAGDSRKLLLEVLAELGIQSTDIPAGSSEVRRQALSRIEAVVTRSGSQQLLLCGRLLQTIGRYDAASSWLHEYLRQADPGVARVGVARAHLWLAQMNKEVTRPRACQKHLWSAMTLFESVLSEELCWADMTEMLRLSHLVGDAHWKIVMLIGVTGSRDREVQWRGVLSQRWYFAKRKLDRVFREAGSGRLEKAREVLATLDRKDPSLHYELRADVDYWTAAVVTACVDRPDFPDGEKEEAEAHGLVQGAADIYERFQIRDKLIDALILLAEREIQGWPHWAYASADLAYRVSEFVGDNIGGASAQWIMAKASEDLERRPVLKARVGVPILPSRELRERALQCRRAHEASTDVLCC